MLQLLQLFTLGLASAMLIVGVCTAPAEGLRIGFGAPQLAPMTYALFCRRYSEDCPPARGTEASLSRPTKMTNERLDELIEVNMFVNTRIMPQRNEHGLAGEQWIIDPILGDCNDYAVSKRHELLARGWPMGDLLLSEVVTPSGEHHLVLVARTSTADFVLDNLQPHVRDWAEVTYRWVRIQVPNSNYWASIEPIHIGRQ
jgi:predicted transglutaminase-like cysteine proteinase